MRLRTSKWILLVVAALFLGASVFAQMAGGQDDDQADDDGPPGGVDLLQAAIAGMGPRPGFAMPNPLMVGLRQRLGSNFTPEMRAAIRESLRQNHLEIDKCAEGFARDVSAAFGLPVEAIANLFMKSPDEIPQTGGQMLMGKKISRLIGRHIHMEDAKKLRAAGERRSACVKPWRNKLARDIADIVRLPLGEIEAMLPKEHGPDSPGVLGGQGGAGLEGPGEMKSSYLEGSILVCAGRVRPLLTERVLLPLLSAVSDKLRGKTVLNVGLGIGLPALYPAQLGATKVVGTDVDPDSIACAEENVRRLGLSSSVEARLVRASDPSVYSAIKPGEQFDVVIGGSPTEVNRIPIPGNRADDEGLPTQEILRLGISLIDGLQEHLSPDGAAILHYPSDVVQPAIVSYARGLGYIVEYHPALQVQAADWTAVYNSYATMIARSEHLDPAALLLPRPPNDLFSPENANYAKLDWEDEGVVLSRLWDTDVDRILPGLVVIRKPAKRTDRPEQKSPALLK